MSIRAGLFGIVVVAVTLLVPAAATASTGDIIAPQHPPLYTKDDGWQAGTCTEEPPLAAAFCSPESPAQQFFETAAGHPNWGFTQFIVKSKPGLVGPEEPIGELKTVHVDLPVGLSVNPQATPQCPLADFKAGAGNCLAATKVGYSEVTASVSGVPFPPAEPLTKVPVYNVEPEQEEPARFGLELADNEVFLEAEVAWEGDYHEGFTIAVPKAIPVELAPLVEGAILKNRLVFDGRSGDGTFITTPGTCLGEAAVSSGTAYSTFLLAGSVKEEAEPGYQFPASAFPRFESPIPPGTSPKSCATIPFEPSVDVAPGATETNSPAGVAVDLQLPHIKGDDSKGGGGQVGEKQDSSNVKDATVTLPPYMGLNPSAANGLRTCSDEQFGKGTRNPVACPAESRVGTVSVETPPLPPGSLSGDIFVGRQLSRDPLSGQEYRIFIEAKSVRYGISARLIGNVKADPRTGRLTTTIASNPQVPVTSFRVDFDDGPRAVVSSPPICGPSTTTSSLVPWAPIAPVAASAGFGLVAAPGGGPCAKTMAERPFSPGFVAKPVSSKAGAYSPMTLNIARTDGQQELKGVDITLPPGFSGKLKGIPYCSEAALNAAAAAAGEVEAKSPSCPAASLVGTATTVAGTGSAPLRIAGGKVFLSGPYRGAPLSLAVVAPATAGPFDLGTAVVRVALFVEPETAQIRAVSDPIPDVFGGAQLSIRAVDVKIDRERFTLNPTSCGPLSTAGALAGGGADPTDPAAFSSLPVATPFQTSDCEKLGFRPKLVTQLLGGPNTVKRSKFPRFRAVLRAREGDANIGRAAVTLPHSLFLEQAHIRTICTRVQLAARACPARSIYGYAKAETPLLDEPLQGPVYLVSSNNELPDLLADLRGQVNVRLRGVISAAKERIKNVFYPVADVPVSKFTLNMKGGKKGLLVTSRDLCARPSFSFMNLKAQNGKRLTVKRLPLRVPACRGAQGQHGR